jgi:ABC-type uncharacterized transport system substrate-binding protein
MRRREVIAGLGAAAMLPLAGRAQGRPRLVMLHSGFAHRTPIEQLYGALKELGYEDQRTVEIELLSADGDPERLRSFVGHLAAQPPSLVIALTSPAVLALKQARVAAPVVFVFVADPVGLGIVDSLARPGGAYTGVSFSTAVLGAKRLDFLASAVPSLRRVAVLWSPMFRENGALADSVRVLAASRGIEVFAREVKERDDIVPAFSDARQAGAQAVVFVTDNALFGHRRIVAEAALTHRLPSIHAYPPEARDGALMSYGPELRESYRRTAALADRILKGASAAELPVEEPTRFTLVLNLKIAAALGLEIPPSILAQADEVIE